MDCVRSKTLLNQSFTLFGDMGNPLWGQLLKSVTFKLIAEQMEVRWEYKCWNRDMCIYSISREGSLWCQLRQFIRQFLFKYATISNKMVKFVITTYNSFCKFSSWKNFDNYKQDSWKSIWKWNCRLLNKCTFFVEVKRNKPDIFLNLIEK